METTTKLSFWKSARASKLFFGFFIILGVFAASSVSVHAASLYFSPDSGNFTEDHSFTVSVYVESADQAMNAASGVVSFPIDKLQVVDISKTGSVFNLWVQEPSFSNLDGTARFEGIVLNPGFIGSAGKILSITFRPRAASSPRLTFSSGSVLANDGNGTNILKSLGDSQYEISAAAYSPPHSASIPEPVIRSSTHPDESKWYNASTAEFSWDIPAGVDGVAYALNSDSEASLSGSQQKGTVSSVTFNLSDYGEGVLYFHVRFHTKDGWGGVGHKLIRVDFSSPSGPSILRKPGDDELTNPQPEFSFKSSDSVSGIAGYKIRLGADWLDAATSSDGYYILPLQSPGDHVLQVRVYDNAGNFSEAGTPFSVTPIEMPRILSYSEKINSSNEPFKAEGSSLPAATITLHLRKAGAFIDFSTAATEQGHWTAIYSKAIPSGVWDLTAQATDARGAVSNETEKYPVDVRSFQNVVVGFLERWGLIALLALIVLGALTGGAYILVHSIRILKLRLRRELLKVKSELRKDLRGLEKDLDLVSNKGRNIDLSPERVKEKEEKLKEEIRHVEEDIEKEIGEIDKIK